ncbi:MAG: DNA cytosine methyltransferase, partial [Burkholderiaceae bacterium]|nr:DNA cytosine methyltransferase [Burkholderiaceae bacterium]
MPSACGSTSSEKGDPSTGTRIRSYIRDASSSGGCCSASISQVAPCRDPGRRATGWPAPAQATRSDAEYRDDITRLRSLPASTDLICAGFPCQDLSQAGRTAGLDGERSGLIAEVFRLLSRRRVPTVVVENVPFMLQLNGGNAMRAIVDEFERRGYRWAYRVVDTFSFGLPQRRERVFLVASRVLDPAEVLLADDRPLIQPGTDLRRLAHGFYWTEGLGGLGWAVDAVPTLKNGSTIGIPSPPAILMPDGSLIKPDIRDGERLQGFA